VPAPAVAHWVAIVSTWAATLRRRREGWCGPIPKRRRPSQTVIAPGRAPSRLIQGLNRGKIVMSMTELVAEVVAGELDPSEFVATTEAVNVFQHLPRRELTWKQLHALEDHPGDEPPLWRRDLHRGCRKSGHAACKVAIKQETGEADMSGEKFGEFVRRERGVKDIGLRRRWPK
jgi:hypothetical protein